MSTPTARATFAELYQPGHEINDRYLHGLEFLWLEITDRCNLECVHCYADSSPRGSLRGSMEGEDWKRVIAQAADLGCRSIQFIGGEPTLHPDLDGLIAYANLKGVDFIELYTNATTLTENRVKFLRDYGVQIATSFYSCDEGTHDSITQRGGSFRKTVLGIDNTLKAGLSLRVGLVLMDNNARDREATMAFLQSRGVHHIGEDRLRHVGRGGVVHLTTKADPYAQLCGHCWKGRVCVTASGNAYPCVFSRTFLLGNLLQASLAEIVASRTLQDFRTTQKDRSTEVAQCSPGCDPGAQCTPKVGTCDPSCDPGRMPCNPQVCNPYQTCGPTR
jgi:MoaA/NifB/PqqE/SkfB family radical SAM enzyme